MLSIKELFSQEGQYVIPIYQRNYDWKHTQLRQLIQDIWDSCNYNPERNYYIGTLVVYPAPKGNETIDGQQRLTTLNIILCAMKNEMEDENGLYFWFRKCNVEFEFREKSSKSMRKLYEHISPVDIDEISIGFMYEQVPRIIEDVLSKNSHPDQFAENFAKFREYLFNKVIITQVQLPNETDLNHYFEIMNTRGEQLEKHEILKARILNPLMKDPAALKLGSRIWEACADMGRYVQCGFASKEIRQCVFSEDLDTLTAHDFDGLVSVSSNSMGEESNSLFSIMDLLKSGVEGIKSSSRSVLDSRDEDDAERFHSVIDFPNFLLQVLRITSGQNIPLDDKRLLSSFPQNPDSGFSKLFLYQLLKIRYLFDKFIIKRDLLDERRRGKWNILKLKIQKHGFSYNNSFEENQKENIMIQSMFHVSLPSQNYKHWLCGALLHLTRNEDGSGLYEYLTNLSHAYMLDRFMQPGSDQADYYDIIFKNGGKPKKTYPSNFVLPRFDTHIDTFFFNFLDMQLWLQGKDPDFTFTARNSVEHFYPQHPMENFLLMDENELHSFGNLCLIGAAKNSRLSNFSPLQKTDFYQKSPVDSLKQKRMMDICKSKGDWTATDIHAHEKEMETVLLKSLS